MPAKSSPTWACRIEERKMKSFPPPATPAGSLITRGSTRGACTIAARELRPKASRPLSSTAKLRLLLNTRGNGCAGSRPTGVSRAHHLSQEVTVNPRLLLRVPVGAAQKADTLVRHLREQRFIEQRVLPRHHG